MPTKWNHTPACRSRRDTLTRESRTWQKERDAAWPKRAKRARKVEGERTHRDHRNHAYAAAGRPKACCPQRIPRNPRPFLSLRRLFCLLFLRRLRPSSDKIIAVSAASAGRTALSADRLILARVTSVRQQPVELGASAVEEQPERERPCQGNQGVDAQDVTCIMCHRKSVAKRGRRRMRSRRQKGSRMADKTHAMCSPVDA